MSTGVTGNIIAYILVRVNLGKEDEVLEQINKLSNIDEVRIVYGEYDMIIKVKVNTLYELDKVVTHVRRLNGVITTTTLISS
ncbi:MAG: Lrp/AsnC ligand binding domain-containing protein [Sulfolobales archaeon]